LPLILLIESIFFSWFAFSVFYYHSFLLITNQTTYEDVKKKWKTVAGNPYSSNKIYRNIWKKFEGKILSKLRLREFVFFAENKRKKQKADIFVKNHKDLKTGILNKEIIIVIILNFVYIYTCEIYQSKFLLNF
jgi:hypothetical protein